MTNKHLIKKTTLEQLYIVGITVKTSNKDQQVAVDIPQLWEKFWSEDIINKIPNKVNNDIYCVYGIPPVMSV